MLFGKLSYSLLIKTVPCRALGDIIHNVCAHAFEIIVEDRRCGYTVAVIVSVNADKLIIVYFFVNCSGSLVHIFDKERVGQVGNIKKVYHLLKIGESTRRQHLKGKPVYITLLCEFGSLCLIAF